MKSQSQNQSNDFLDFFNLLKKGDPLVIHDSKDKPKTPEIELGIKGIQGHVFAPSIMSAPMLTKGHGQTFIVGMKESYNAKFGKEFKYDHRELIKFKDGGQTYLDCKGKCFVEGKSSPEDKDRPFLCICPGLTSASDCIYVLNFVDEAY